MKTENFKKESELLENNFIETLRHKGLELSENTVCLIDHRTVVIGVNYMKRQEFETDFASEITIYRKSKVSSHGINFGSSGTFTPVNKSSFWRTMHAAEVLKKWDDVCELVDIYCEKYETLVSQELKNLT